MSAIPMMQREQRWTIDGDTRFPEGRHQLSANGKQALCQYVLRLQSLQNAKIVVYGYTDRSAARLAPRRQCLAYLGSPGVMPDLISAGRLGDAHPVASNDTPDQRGKNTRLDVLHEPSASPVVGRS